MSLITQETYPNTTLVYSVNNCVKCRQTKMLLTREGINFVEVNIQDDENMDEYVAPKSLGMESWNDFRQDLIKELKKKLSDKK